MDSIVQQRQFQLETIKKWGTRWSLKQISESGEEINWREKIRDNGKLMSLFCINNQKKPGENDPRKNLDNDDNSRTDWTRRLWKTAPKINIWQIDERFWKKIRNDTTNKKLKTKKTKVKDQ